MLYKTGFVSVSPTVAEWQATQKCVTDRHKIFPLTAIAPILNGGWGQQGLIIFNTVGVMLRTDDAGRWTPDAGRRP